MSRPWRIEFSGALYHVLSRGNEQGNVFIDDEDRNNFISLLGEISSRFDAEVFAYVLLDNHYHILLRTNRPNLSKAMQWMGVTYTRRFNNRHGRSGHLFQGRFKSLIVENNAYLVELSCSSSKSPSCRDGQTADGLQMEQLSCVCLRQESSRMAEETNHPVPIRGGRPATGLQEESAAVFRRGSVVI